MHVSALSRSETSSAGHGLHGAPSFEKLPAEQTEHTPPEAPVPSAQRLHGSRPSSETAPWKQAGAMMSCYGTDAELVRVR